MPIVKTNPYQCDGPGCTEQTDREPKTQYPANWIRATIHQVGAKPSVGSFHDPSCLIRWTGALLVPGPSAKAGADAAMAEAEVGALIAAGDVEVDDD